MMNEYNLRATAEVHPGIRLDPRTKLFLLFTVTTLMFTTSNEGMMNVVKPVLTLLPFALLLSARRYRTAAEYLALYAVCYVLERVALHAMHGTLSYLVLLAASIMTRYAPGVMAAAWLVATTSVSEFIAAMERMDVPQMITIPMSVIFRFIPTIGEEYQAISDAMRMRGIRFGGRHPLQMIEYRLVPLMISVVRIGDELSAAALTRGLGAPTHRTNICKIGLHLQDYVVMGICILAYVICILGL